MERANSLSLHKNQLQRDYIAFTEPSKPFIRTDKGTVKRRATLALYAEYIERFYGSRSDDVDERFLAIDTSSTESITCAIRHIFGSLLPALKDAPTDEDIFSLGFDSLLIFRAIKSVRAATGLHERLSTRHLYASPTLVKCLRQWKFQQSQLCLLCLLFRESSHGRRCPLRTAAA